MLYKSLRLLFGILLFGVFNNAAAQEGSTLELSQQYVLGGIKVAGKVGYNEQTVVTFTGLEKGQLINVPGEEISNAIKGLSKLNLFSDIEFYQTEVRGDTIFLELYLNKLPELSDVKVQGIKKKKGEAIIKDAQLTKGKIVNENLITNTKYYIENKYKKDGFYNTKVAINVIPDSTNTVKMVVNIDRGKKVKVSSIKFNGNTKLSDKKLRGAMKNTKKKSFLNPIRIFKPSRFIEDKYREDLTSIVTKYKEKGYRDARVVSDTVAYNAEKNTIAINIAVEEGRKYYFGDIKYLGNTVYTTQALNQKLGIKKGDVYNGTLLQERIQNTKKPDGDDLTNMYQNNGYLFSNINAVEVATANDTIDFEIRVTEGPIAYYNNITVTGNDKTNDRVIYRELRTRPGQRWNKEDVISTIRELGTLGFFDAEAIRPDVKNADPASGTVDIDWNVVEKGSSQIELQGGYGGGGFIGTLGLSFNNFSLRSIFDKEAYKPIPMGDGQKVSLRAQGSTYFQTYSLSLTEPWFGGKKPIQFSTSLSHSKQFLYNFQSRDVDRNKSFNITSLSVGIAKRLSSYRELSFSQALSFQYYDLSNYNTGLFNFGNGNSKNLAYTVGLTRNNKGNSLIYPEYGSEFSVSAKVTFPYSLVNGVDYGNLGNLEENKLRNATGQFIDANGNTVDDFRDAAPDVTKVDQKRFEWLEYYKIKFRGDWYTRIYHRLVLRTLGEFGYLGAYNSERGLVPFERFFLGGDGLANFALDGREVIQLRGYPNQALSSINGGTIYNKFSLELRYPITLGQNASIYALTFAEAGASYDTFRDYNPFLLKRSAGLGLRVFMPAFGLLGIDFGHGFDPIPGGTQKNGWETHFIIGQQF